MEKKKKKVHYDLWYALKSTLLCWYVPDLKGKKKKKKGHIDHTDTWAFARIGEY